MLDCYGPLTPEATNLLEVVQAKSILREIGIKRLDMSDGMITVTFADGNRIDQNGWWPRFLKSHGDTRSLPTTNCGFVSRTEHPWTV